VVGAPPTRGDRKVRKFKTVADTQIHILFAIVAINNKVYI